MLKPRPGLAGDKRYWGNYPRNFVGWVTRAAAVLGLPDGLGCGLGVSRLPRLRQAPEVACNPSHQSKVQLQSCRKRSPRGAQREGGLEGILLRTLYRTQHTPI